MRTLAIVLGLALLGGCSHTPAGPDAPAGLAALSVTGGIVIVNDDVVDRYYVLFEGQTAAMVDLYFGPDGEEHWIRIAAGASRLVPWSEVDGFHPRAESVVIHSWTGVRAHPVGNGVQWLAEGFATRIVHL